MTTAETIASETNAGSGSAKLHDAVRRANPVGTLTFLAVNAISWQPLREVFVDTPERAVLLTRLTWLTLFVALSGALFRAARIPWWLGPPVSLAFLFWQIQSLAARDLEVSGTPFRESPRWYQHALRTARDSLSDVDRIKSPAVAIFGFVAIALTLGGLLLVISHILAFEVEGVFESLLPPAAMLAVSSALSPGQGGAGDSRRWAILFVAFAGAHVIADGDRKRRRRTRWLNMQSPSGGRAIAAVAVFGALLLFGASVLSVRLGAGPLDRSVDWRTGLPKIRTVDSPTVSLRRRLVDLSNTPMFRVDARDESNNPVRTYWRQSGLDRFDGTTWSQSPRKYQNLNEGTKVRDDGYGSTGGQRIRQTITIDGLVDEWLPTAYRPTRLLKGPVGMKVSIDPTTGSVIVNTATSPFLTYTFEAQVPEVPESSSQAGDPELERQMTALPALVTDRVRRLANEVVAPGGNDRVAQARLLEKFFQSKFEYSTSTRWSGQNPLENFLFDDRVGYCEQFASAFAAMARSVGIPARVAVGFTPGQAEPDGRFLVTGENAHAWPEILLGDVGWVPFEPTPGRGLLTTPATTTTTTLPPVSSTVPNTVAATPELIPVPEEESKGRLWWLLGAAVLLTLGAASALYRFRPGFRTQRRLERERQLLLADVPSERVDLEWAWYQLLQAFDDRETPGPSSDDPADTKHGIPRLYRSPTLTPLELANHAANNRTLSDAQLQSFRHVVAVVTEARFAPQGSVARDRLASATVEADSLRRELAEVAGPTSELLHSTT
jgi:transglutaminase-like putative cysteine protease